MYGFKIIHLGTSESTKIRRSDRVINIWKYYIFIIKMLCIPRTYEYIDQFYTLLEFFYMKGCIID